MGVMEENIAVPEFMNKNSGITFPQDAGP